MMWAPKVSRSTTALQSRASVNMRVHSPKGRLVVTMMLAASSAFGEDLEEQFGAGLGGLDVAELIQAEELIAGIAANDARELMGVTL